MRIIAFVGSPVEDNEKDVSLMSCVLFCTNLTVRNVFLLVVHVCTFFSISPCFCPNLLILQLVKLAKRLKKEKVNVDVINFGEEVRKSCFIFHCTAVAE